METAPLGDPGTPPTFAALAESASARITLTVDLESKPPRFRVDRTSGTGKTSSDDLDLPQMRLLLEMLADVMLEVETAKEHTP